MSIKNDPKKLKVAMLVARFPVISETFVLDQVRGLIERGHSVDIFTAGAPTDALLEHHEDFDRLCLQDRTYSAMAKPKGNWHRLQQSAGIFHRQAMCSPQRTGKWVLQKLLRKSVSLRLLDGCSPELFADPYDVLHCQFGTLGRQGVQLAELGASFKRLVLNFRGVDISAELRRRGRKFYAPMLARADMIMVNCDFFAERLRKLQCSPRKLVVHRTGIACDRFQFRPPRPVVQRPVRLITVGRLVEKKGMEYSIRAVAELVRQGRQIEYRIVGDGPLFRSCQDQVRRLGINRFVRFLGAMSQRDIIEQLQASDLFVTANTTGRDGNQDAPVNTLKEAMAVGLPVVATRHGGIPELVDDDVTGFLVPERDESELAQRVAWLIDHPCQWGRLASAGRQRIERDYDLEDWNDLLVDRYRQVVRQTRGAGGDARQTKEAGRAA